MSKPKDNNRRDFIKKLSASAMVAVATPATLAGTISDKKIQILKRRSHVTANDRINIACIGMGIMGFGDVDCVLGLDGVEFIAAADSYTGHLRKVKEVYGDQVKTTLDYQEILDNPEVDAVIIATPDHWHARHAIASMRKKKPVYLEKPIVQHLEEGAQVIEVQQQTKVPFQVGSQWASSIVIHKAKELFEAGEIGELNFVEVYTDRFGALAAWQYSIPTDASPETCDWKTFQGGVTDLPFDPVRFFRWRNYQDYGTGMAGDLFVHLFTRLHTITGSAGPERIYTTGNLNYWKDGRDVADLMLGLFDYPKTEQHPAFNLSLRVNFVDGSGGGDQLRLVGSEGEMVLGHNNVVIRKKQLQEAPGFGGWDTYDTFAEQEQKDFVAKYNEQYGHIPPRVEPVGEIAYQAPRGYNMRADHFNNWLQAIRSGNDTTSGAVFGFRAAAPALASNLSYNQKKIINWDPIGMKLV